MNTRPIAFALLLACMAPAAHAGDARIEALLKAADMTYEVDKDDDYKIVVEWKNEARSQLVYVSGTVENLGDIDIVTVFSPAFKLGEAGLDGARARHLLAENGKKKLGAWEISGSYLYYSSKFPIPASHPALSKALWVTAEIADDMELELTPGKDDL